MKLLEQNLKPEYQVFYDPVTDDGESVSVIYFKDWCGELKIINQKEIDSWIETSGID